MADRMGIGPERDDETILPPGKPPGPIDREQSLDTRSVVRRVAALLEVMGKHYPSREMAAEGDFLRRVADNPEPIAEPVVVACRLALIAAGVTTPDPAPMLRKMYDVDDVRDIFEPRPADTGRPAAPLLLGNTDRPGRRAAVLRARTTALDMATYHAAAETVPDVLRVAERFETWLLRDDPGAVT